MGRDMSADVKTKILTDEKELVSFDHVGIQLGDFELHDMTFTIPKGYLIGLTGKNNAGKSTLIKMLLGNYKHYSGSIQIMGAEVKKYRQDILAYLGYVSSDHSFFMERTALENGELLCDYYPVWDQSLYVQMLKRFGIGKIALANLSKGNFVKYQLAFALAHKPKLLILDEPTTGLDPVFRREFLQILQDVICQEDCSILLATHLKSDLERIADYMIQINGNTSIWKVVDRYVEAN